MKKELFTVKNQQIQDIPVYEVEGNESGKIRKPHRNHLYLVDNQISDKVEDDKKNGYDDEKYDNVDEESEIIEEKK
jgi:hypothetical protein